MSQFAKLHPFPGRYASIVATVLLFATVSALLWSSMANSGLPPWPAWLLGAVLIGIWAFLGPAKAIRSAT